MKALTSIEIVEILKQLLPIDDPRAYDYRLEFYTKSAMSKLKEEGVENIYEDATSDEACNYINCIAYQVAKDMDFDLDSNRTDEQYITRVNELRTSQIKHKHGNQNNM